MDSPGTRIAAEFSRDKCHLTDAEQRRLAGMIDAPAPLNTRLAEMVRKLEWAGMSYGRHCCPICHELRERTVMGMHHATCPLAALLTEIDAVPDPDRSRIKSCGCIICCCEDEERCHGCGAKSCAQHSTSARKARVERMAAEIDAAPGKPEAGKGAVEELVAAAREIANDIESLFSAAELADGGGNSLLGGYRDRLRSALAAIDPGAGTERGITMKIVLNKCFGGFGLSRPALRRYCDLKGRPCFFFDNERDPTGRVRLGSYRLLTDDEKAWIYYPFDIDNPNEVIAPDKSGAAWKAHHIDVDRIPRNDPDLVRVVEEMGDKASGDCAQLRVVNIPDGVEWEIDEYDGMETAEERHATLG